MKTFGERYAAPPDIPAVVPVFPLERAIVLPRRELPLNIFEPRYLAMVDHAVGGDRLIGMVQPADGGTPEKPALETVGGLGRISAYSELPDRRCLICLTGVCRFRILEELEAMTPFRQCRIEVAPFAEDFLGGERSGQVDRAKLLSVFADYLKANGLEADWDSVANSDTESLVDTLSMLSPFGVQEKQALLEAGTPAVRAEMLVALTERALAAGEGGSGTVLQ